MATLEATPVEPTVESLQQRVLELEREKADWLVEKAQLQTQLIAKEARVDQLTRENEVLREAHGEILEQNSEKDERLLYDRLTGLKSISYFEEEMRHYFSRARAREDTEKRAGQEKTPMCLVVLDI